MTRFGACVLFTSCFLLAAPALGAPPRSIADCAAIANAFAYNNCLASFGPPQKGQRAKSESDLSSPAIAPAAPSRPVGRAVGRGRYRAEFNVGGGGRVSPYRRWRRYRR